MFLLLVDIKMMEGRGSGKMKFFKVVVEIIKSLVFLVDDYDIGKVWFL